MTMKDMSIMVVDYFGENVPQAANRFKYGISRCYDKAKCDYPNA